VSAPAWRYPLAAFRAVGVELEYAIVDRATLDVRPLADRLFAAQAGIPVAELARGPLSWSNELANHVIELKTTLPAPGLAGLDKDFSREVGHIDALLAPLGARLMPTGMHPWMDPRRELVLWPHEGREIYQTFDRIFDCRRHGWANLQSVQLNLPFADAGEFARLHAALRVLLPLLPALAASSPVAEGAATGLLDNRLEHYRSNCRRVPSLAGLVIPEPVFTREAYEGELLPRLYADLEPFAGGRALCHEWINARGAIARFERGALEIRLLDTQECPRADFALCAAVAAVAQALARPEPAFEARLRACDTAPLAILLEDAIARADEARIADLAFLELLGLPPRPRFARDVWGELVARHLSPHPGFADFEPALALYAEQGCLARRILARLSGDLRRESLRETWAELCRCLADAELFRAR
jgi:gamma-glutamyl:cysteine ligase YbdK (ATP-grasp superfamily)